MSGVTQALVEESLELSNMFRQNAALKNGLPDCRRVTPPKIEDPVSAEATPPQPTPINITNNIPPAPATNSPSPGATIVDAAKDSLLRRSAPWLASAAVGVGSGLTTAWYMKPEKAPVAPPAIVQPAEQKKQDAWLLQWLQENGRHLPEGTWQK